MNGRMNAEKKRREVKKRQRSFALLPHLLHPVLIDTETLKQMSAWVQSCVCGYL